MQKPVKIMHVATIDMSLRFLLLNFLIHLQKLGFHVSGISSPGSHVSFIESHGIQHFPVTITRKLFTPIADLLAIWELYRIFCKERPTIVHTHTPKAGFLGRFAAKMAAVPLVVHTNHGFLFRDRSSKLWKTFILALETIAARCCDLIFSVNQEDIDLALSERVCVRDKITLLSEGGIGIDLAEFDPARIEPARLDQKRKELGVPPGVPIIGFVGRLVREKGLVTLYEAAQLLAKRGKIFRLLIIGPIEPDKTDALSIQVSKHYGISKLCIFTGLRYDLPELYALMDIFVLPSLREGFPRAPMEASAMGIPCVVSDVRGCREAVTNELNGIIVPPNDPQNLMEAISRLLDNSKLAKAYGMNGRCIALKRFDERLAFSKTIAEYYRIMEAKGLHPKSFLD